MSQENPAPSWWVVIKSAAYMAYVGFIAGTISSLLGWQGAFDVSLVTCLIIGSVGGAMLGATFGVVYELQRK
jgi:hypothetical protein